MTDRYAHVALPLPLAEPYSYRIPAALGDRALPGARVVVPVRNRELVGVVTAVDVPAPSMAARDLLATPDPSPALPSELLALAERLAGYYGAPIGLTLHAMLPAALWGHSSVDLVLVGGRGRVGGTAEQLVHWLADRGGRAAMSTASRALKRPLWDVVDRLQRVGMLALDVQRPDTSAGVAEVRLAVIMGDPLSLLQREERFRRAPKQRRLYELLESAGGREPVATLLARAGITTAPLKSLVSSGLVSIEMIETRRDPFADLPHMAPPEQLTDAQRGALGALSAMSPGESALLFGVTGSGKTLVYLERIREVLNAGRGAIVLVPEIALTPQTVSRVRGMFGDDVAVLHSALSDGERADAWRSLRRGERRVAVGARSAVFAPVRNLGVIVLDEEHETSYKNGETPRYHARTVAAMRAQHEGATLILGSATPSLESWAAMSRAGRVIRLPERIAARPMPPVELIDLRSEPQVVRVAGLPWSQRLDDAVTAALARQEQVLLLLNRRGWAAFIQCLSCGHVVDCPRCSISLTVHRQPAELRCHYCDHRQAVPTQCPACGGEATRLLGAGTQQLEELVASRFPEARLARMDLDTTAGKWSHHAILERVGRGDVDILLGTQMIAKGIDFPNVTVVGVVDADTALHLPDFRASERTFQLIAQVAGRTGRGPKGGRVLVQTRQPEHHALTHAARHDAEGFLEAEIPAREFPAYPPHVAIANITVSGTDQAAVTAHASAVAEWCERTIAHNALPLIVLGPSPCPIERIKDRWRHHLIIKGPTQDIGRWVRAAAPRLAKGRGEVRVAVDRDPLSLL